MIDIMEENDLDLSGVIPFGKDEPRYRLRDLSNFCKERGITMDMLTDEQLEQFRTN